MIWIYSVSKVLHHPVNDDFNITLQSLQNGHKLKSFTESRKTNSWGTTISENIGVVISVTNCSIYKIKKLSCTKINIELWRQYFKFIGSFKIRKYPHFKLFVDLRLPVLFDPLSNTVSSLSTLSAFNIYCETPEFLFFIGFAPCFLTLH